MRDVPLSSFRAHASGGCLRLLGLGGFGLLVLLLLLEHLEEREKKWAKKSYKNKIIQSLSSENIYGMITHYCGNTITVRCITRPSMGTINQSIERSYQNRGSNQSINQSMECLSSRFNEHWQIQSINQSNNLLKALTALCWTFLAVFFARSLSFAALNFAKKTNQTIPKKAHNTPRKIACKILTW